VILWRVSSLNPLNAELNPICYLLALLGAHRILHFSRIRVKDVITGFFQVLMWILAMLCGMVLGKLLIHGYLCGKLLRLKMFRDDQVQQ